MPERVRGMRFEIGRLCASRQVAADMSSRPRFAEFVKSCIDRYFRCDWGDVSAADGKANSRAVEYGGERILAAYRYSGREGWKIWILTEADRSVTTILYPEEY